MKECKPYNGNIGVQYKRFEMFTDNEGMGQTNFFEIIQKATDTKR